MIKVTDVAGNKHELQGRLERMVACIIANAGSIARPQNAQIVFDCSGGKVVASIKLGMEIPDQETG
jgi:hypothetical protein